MYFKVLALYVAASPLANTYLINGDVVNCRKGPNISHDAVKTYKEGTDVTITCHTNGENIQGDCLWDKAADGCYVANFYVKTGTSNMVTKECNSGSSSGDSTTTGKIKRSEIISRGQFWVSHKVQHSMTDYYPDPKGVKYRTDCSGFVSMALNTSQPGYGTVSLPEVAKSINWDELKPGDFVGTPGPGTDGAAGHVTLCHSWVDSGRKK